MSWEKTKVMLLAVCTAAPGTQPELSACTTILVGRKATADGAVLMSSSCDGNQMGRVYLVPGRDDYGDRPVPMTRNGRDTVGHLPPLERTHRCLVFGAGTLGGMNEHGVSIALEYIPMREGLTSQAGVVSPYSSHWTTSLIANGLMRARTARQAVQLIGAMVEDHGFLYTWAGDAGVALPIADKTEVWLLEIFGPERGWTADSGQPGGVWCAQRVPDHAVGVSANRSRIGRVDPDDPETFLASANLYSLARQMGFWEEGQPFVWHEVYGGAGNRGNALREWRVLSQLAPSQGLAPRSDPASGTFPFSVPPDHPVTVARLMAVMRDGYEDSEFDLTADPAFQVEGEKSPLARPWGPPELFDLLEVEPERTISTPASNFVFISQARQAMPDPIGSLAWFAHGPAATSCLVPIYPGVRELPDAWTTAPDLTRIDRGQVAWNYRLVANLANQLRYQDVMQDVRQFLEPAEAAFFARQTELEATALRVYESQGAEAVRDLLTEYVQGSLNQVGAAYDQLVDYLMFQYLYDRPDLAPATRPQVKHPALPTNPANMLNRQTFHPVLQFLAPHTGEWSIPSRHRPTERTSLTPPAGPSKRFVVRDVHRSHASAWERKTGRSGVP